MIIIQDYRTCKVLGIKKSSFNEISKIKINDSVSLIESSNKGQFIVKQILIDNSKENALIKVKVNKDSKLFSEISQFNEINQDPYAYLRKLETQIQDIILENKKTQNHSILKKGTPKIAKKFGEEAVELVIESGKNNDDLFINEAADVLYYFTLLLHERGLNMGEILKKLKKQKRNI